MVATIGVFAFAAPEYRPRYESKMIDFSKQEYDERDEALLERVKAAVDDLR